MPSAITNSLDIRGMGSHKVKAAIADRAALIEPNGSFWITSEKQPTDLYPHLESLGFHHQTFLYSPTECRVFVGRT